MRISLVWAAAPFYYLYQAVCGTLRFHERNRESVDGLDRAGERMVFCLWHDELFPLMRVKRNLDIVTVVSPSRDGELLARVLERLGLRTVRGSSTRGGMKALLGASRLMKREGIHACITVDGPMGPRHKAKDGAFFLSAHADAWIVPVRILPRPVFHLPTWDRFKIPVPFGHVDIYFASPWKVDPDKLDDSGLISARTRLERELEELVPSPGKKSKEPS